MDVDFPDSQQDQIHSSVKPSVKEIIKPCACKGIRRCLLCERFAYGSNINTAITYIPPSDSLNATSLSYDPSRCCNSYSSKSFSLKVLVYCPECQYAFKDSDHSLHNTQSETDCLAVNGIVVQPDFLSVEEEATICSEMDRIPWVDSQSGRRKQDFGPKVNFKRKKIKCEPFQGFPSFAQIFIERLKSVPVLKDFFPVEMCDLEYEPSRGSSIDAHFDDFWLWGERLVTVNLLSETYYCLTRGGCATEVLVHLPARSLVVLYGDARFSWMHSIQRDHIIDRRLAINIRELSPPFLMGGEFESIGNDLLSRASTFLNFTVR